jgi:hypothetical protein
VNVLTMGSAPMADGLPATLSLLVSISDRITVWRDWGKQVTRKGNGVAVAYFEAVIVCWERAWGCAAAWLCV